MSAASHVAMLGEGRALRSLSPPAAVDTSFTLASGGALQAQLYDGSDATAAADSSGINVSTHAAFDFTTPKNVGRVRIITAASNGWANSTVFNIACSDTSLTTGFSIVDTITVLAGLSQVSDKLIADFGAHRYWRIFYASGTASGNGWLGELTFYERF